MGAEDGGGGLSNVCSNCSKRSPLILPGTGYCYTICKSCGWVVEDIYLFMGGHERYEGFFSNRELKEKNPFLFRNLKDVGLGRN